MDLNDGNPIEIKDKSLFDKFFQKFPPEISEFSFTNLFIWRNYYNFLFMEWNNHLLIFSEDFLKKRKESSLRNQEKIFFLPPVGPNPTQIIYKLFEDLENIEIHRVPKSIVEKIKEDDKFHSLNIEYIEDPDQWDYVYERDALISLSGNKLRQKRRWLKKFIENYEYKFHLISEEWIDKTRQLQIEWCDSNECMLNLDLIEEQKAINEALDNYSALKFKGGLLCVDDKCVGYSFGELLNPNTMVIHIEKAHKFFEGSYQAINNFFCKNCCESAKFINREQDLGNLGLRQAKKTYIPHHMVEKSIIFRRN